MYQKTKRKNDNGGDLGLFIVLIIFIVGLISSYFAYMYYLKKTLPGVYECTDRACEMLLNPPTINVHIEENQVKIVGLFPDKTGFLVRGKFPFFKSVMLYPIKNPISSHKIDYFPYPKDKEYYLTLYKNDSAGYLYKKIEDLPKSEGFSR